MEAMNGRLKILGVMLAVVGLAFVAGGGYAYYKTNQGSQALQAFSAAQNVNLTYNEAGQLTSGGGTEDADKIMSLLTNDWGYTVDKSELNPNDPLVNTASEYMFQMATTYDFVNDGKYWTGFDRTDPIQGAAREKIWTGTALALIGQLGVGSVTASTLQVGLGMAALMAGLGGVLILFGLGLVWAASAATEKVKAPVLRPATTTA
jgi:hypothetical protein